MATTINAYAVSLELDASKYIDASKLSRQETTALKRDIAAARDPMEKLAIEQDRLTRAVESGAISEEVYQRLLESKRQKLLGAADAAQTASNAEGSMLDVFSKAGNIISGVRNGLDMIGNAVEFVMSKWRAFDEIAEGLDATKDKAEKLGLTFNELGSLQFAAKRLGGDDALSALDSAMGKMLKNGFVDAGESAVDAFKRAANEINAMATQTERAQRAAEIFGKGGVELLAVLQSGADEIGTLADQWERTNGLTQSQLEFIGEYNDRWEDIKQNVDGIVTVFVAEMSPALTVMAEEILGMDKSLTGFRDNARFVSDVIAAMAGNSKDLFEVYSAMSVPQDSSRWAAAADFSSAERMLDDVNAKRLRMETESGLKEIAAKSNRTKAIEDAKLKAAEESSAKLAKSEADSYKSLIDGNATVWDAFMAQRDEKNKLLVKSMAAAEKSLEDNRRSRDRQRNEIAKGPQSIEANTAEAARFMADQANSKIAGMVAGDTQPTDQQLLDEAVKQRDLLIAQAEREKEMNSKLQQVVDAVNSNGFKRIR